MIILRDGLFIGFIMKIELAISYIRKLWEQMAGFRLVKDKGLNNVKVELDFKAMVNVVKGDSSTEQRAFIYSMRIGKSYCHIISHI